MKDWSNQAVFSVLGYDCENESKHKLIGRVAFHVHKLVKVGLNVLIKRNKMILLHLLHNHYVLSCKLKDCLPRFVIMTTCQEIMF